MEDEESFIDIIIPSDKEYLKEFIRVWQASPELWNTSSIAYRDKVKKSLALEKLLEIYKKIKPSSTKEDVKKKLNSLRTNFRKELKKVIQSTISGNGPEEVYTPSSWTYYELLFLKNDEQLLQHSQDSIYLKNEELQVQQSPIVPDVKSIKNEAIKTKEHIRNSVSLPEPTSLSPAIPKAKKKPVIEQQTFMKPAVTYKTESDYSNSIDQEEYHIAKVWAAKLQKFTTIQKILAEKAINDILLEAELRNLRIKKNKKMNKSHMLASYDNETGTLHTSDSSKSCINSLDPFKERRNGLHEEIDSEQYFGLSIVPTLKQLSDDQKLIAKMRILEVLREVRKINTESNVVYMDEASTEDISKVEYSMEEDTN